MATREQIVAKAREWKGVRWKHQGRSATGVDCAGLPILVGKALGLTDVDYTAYPRRPDGSFVEHFRRHLEELLPRDARPGDVLVFAEQGHPCHCGVMTEKHGALAVTHAHALRRQVIEETLDQARSVVGPPIFAFRYPGVED